jgi:hypothetical protein
MIPLHRLWLPVQDNSPYGGSPAMVIPTRFALLSPRERLASGQRVLSEQAALSRDLAVWLVDWKGPQVGSVEKAFGSLARRFSIPKGVFYAARYRPTEALAEWLTHLVAARVAVLKGEIHELETTVAFARRCDRPDLRAAIDEASASITAARAQLEALAQQLQSPPSRASAPDSAPGAVAARPAPRASPG